MQISSSNIQTADYDRTTRLLVITFINRPMWVYTYKKVSPKVWVAFVQSESKGTYFSTHIRDVYQYSRTVRKSKS